MPATVHPGHALLRGEFKEGDTVRVDARDRAVVFGKRSAGMGIPALL